MSILRVCIKLIRILFFKDLALIINFVYELLLSLFIYLLVCVNRSIVKKC